MKYKTFIDSLQSCLDVVNHNRQELAPQTAQAAAITGSYHDNDGAKDDDDDLLDDLGRTKKISYNIEDEKTRGRKISCPDFV